MNCLEGKISLKRVVHVFLFVGQSFNINLTNSRWECRPHSDEVINLHLEDFIILIDIEKMRRLPFNFSVACILEEFVHTCANITDEDLVNKVVAELYEGIDWVDRKYVDVK